MPDLRLQRRPDVRDVAVENGQTVEETLRIMVETADSDHQLHSQEYEAPWEPAEG